MSRYVLSSALLADLLDEPLEYFSRCGIDTRAVVSCGITILSAPSPTRAKTYLTNDVALLVNGRLAPDEISEMFDETARLLRDYLRQITGQYWPSVEIVHFLGNDPVVSTKDY